MVKTVFDPENKIIGSYYVYTNPFSIEKTVREEIAWQRIAVINITQVRIGFGHNPERYMI